jgi:hypothetical protein
VNPIDFSRSRAILVGTARYTHGLPEMTAAHNSLGTMRDLLTGPLCGWPPDRVAVFEDNTSSDRLDQQIAALIHDTTDVLLFYYVGHGQLLDGEHLGLALVDTHAQPKMRHTTSLRLNDVRAELTYRCEARVKLVILDCCFSGIATRNTQGAGLADQVQVAAKVEGAYTLTASRASQKAVYQDGPDGLTYFTKIFAEVVRDGIPGAGAQLTLKAIHKQVAARFRRLNLPGGQLRPEPSVLAVDTAEELTLARNARAAQSAPPPALGSPLLQPPPPHAGDQTTKAPQPTGPRAPLKAERGRWERFRLALGSAALAAALASMPNIPLASDTWTGPGGTTEHATLRVLDLWPIHLRAPASNPDPGFWQESSMLAVGSVVMVLLTALVAARGGRGRVGTVVLAILWNLLFWVEVAGLRGDLHRAGQAVARSVGNHGQ